MRGTTYQCGTPFRVRCEDLLKDLRASEPEAHARR